MSKPEITAKALDLIASVCGDARASELIEVLWNIDQIGNIRALRRLLGPPAPMERSSARSKP
jgi:hypothetical protein